MENKIQQLTEKLYNDGVSKGKEESEKLISEATQKSEQIIADAKAKAEAIIASANSEAEQLSSRSLSELSRSMGQMVEDVKSLLEKSVVAKSVSADVKSAFADTKFIEQLILSSVKAWGEKSSAPLEVAVEESSVAKVEKFLSSKVDSVLRTNVSVSSSVSVKDGFAIVPKNEGYYIKFSSEDFDALLAEYLRPSVAKILFNK